MSILAFAFGFAFDFVDIVLVRVGGAVDDDDAIASTVCVYVAGAFLVLSVFGGSFFAGSVFTGSLFTGYFFIGSGCRHRSFQC